MQGQHRDVSPAQALGKIGIVLDAHDHMPKARLWQTIDQIDEAIFHATHDEVVDDMHDQGPRIVRHDLARSSMSRKFVVTARPRHSSRTAASEYSQLIPRRRTSNPSTRRTFVPPYAER